jgi:hypothetical protein
VAVAAIHLLPEVVRLQGAAVLHRAAGVGVERLQVKVAAVLRAKGLVGLPAKVPAVPDLPVIAAGIQVRATSPAPILGTAASLRGRAATRETTATADRKNEW